MAAPTPTPAPPQRKYDKGERRFKHVGKSSKPKFRRHESKPKQWVGLCPNNFSEDDLHRLVNEAIPAANGDRELPFAKRLHVVEKGAIYRLETTDWGKSYHGYPYRGALTRTIEGQLRAMATQKACLGEYEDWLKDYIELG